MTDNELPMLAGLSAIIRWIEELASLIAGPVLTVGLGIALIDLLTDGRLLTSIPALLFAWAASQAIGLDAQLVGSAAKLAASWRRRSWGAMLGFAILVLALGAVAYQASAVFATQQADGITTAQALARLGMDAATWLLERSALAVLLVILSGLLRYVAPAKVATSTADERAQLERQLELEPLRQRLRAAQVGGWRSVAETALRGQQGVGMAQSGQTLDNASTPFEATGEPPTARQEARQTAPAAKADPLDLPTGGDEPPTGPGSPSFASKRPPERATAATDNVTPLVRRGLGKPPRQTRRQANRANARSGRRGGAEARVRAILAREPGITFDELTKAAKVSPSTASKWQAVWLAEQGASRDALAQ